MKERPILMSAPMVRAILAGTKTQTRRVVKHEWDHGRHSRRRFSARTGGDDFVTFSEPYSRLQKEPIWFYSWGNHRWLCSPFGAPGDRLWVREAWAEVGTLDPGLLVYRADYPACVPAGVENIPDERDFRWSPSIHMPRRASRITLEVTDVRVERLNDITRGDCMAEGCPFPNMAAGDNPRDWYAQLWDQINGPGSWAANPWVWVITFRQIDSDAGRKG